MNPAPIALFAYNRPSHLRQTVEALRASELAAGSVLYVYSDSAKNEGAKASVAEVRSFLREITGFKSVTLVVRDRNWGLANSIIDGVTALCREHGRVIVVEDDLVVSRYFLGFMNDALERFENAEQAMQVSGYMFPISHPERLPESFFCPMASSWGWGTWQRAWQSFEADPRALLAQVSDRRVRRRFNVEDNYDYFGMLEAQARGAVDSWGVRWRASMFLAGGLCLFPRHSLVRNIGMDGSGVHCDVSTRFDVPLAEQPVRLFPDRVEENRAAMEQIVAYFCRGQNGGLTGTARRAARWMRSLIG